MRRLFWVSVGAALGVTGYRRVTALARSLRPRPQRLGRGGGVGAGNSLAGFAADVREGMALYMERQADRAAPSTLEGHARPQTRSRNNELKDGR